MEVKPLLISLRNVSAGYEGKTVLRNVNFDISRDTFVALIGPNGGGKTTVLRLLLGQIEPTEGEVYRLTTLRFGYLPQINDIDMRFPISVEDVVLSGQRHGNRLFPSKATRHKVRDLLSFAQLSDLASRPIGELSGGQRQRVFLCRALMDDPDVLILDEPVTYMDKAAETNLYKLLPRLRQKMAVVLVSHDIGTVSSLVDTIACVGNGTLHHHLTNRISEDMLSVYECPVEIVTHGSIPHRVLKSHNLL